MSSFSVFNTKIDSNTSKLNLKRMDVPHFFRPLNGVWVLGENLCKVVFDTIIIKSNYLKNLHTFVVSIIVIYKNIYISVINTSSIRINPETSTIDVQWTLIKDF